MIVTIRERLFDDTPCFPLWRRICRPSFSRPRSLAYTPSRNTCGSEAFSRWERLFLGDLVSPDFDKPGVAAAAPAVVLVTQRRFLVIILVVRLAALDREEGTLLEDGRYHGFAREQFDYLLFRLFGERALFVVGDKNSGQVFMPVRSKNSFGTDTAACHGWVGFAGIN